MNAALHTYSWDVQGNLDKKDLGLPTARDFNSDYGNRDRGMAGLEGFRYDGHGRRVSTWLPTQGKTRFYLYVQSGQLLYEANETAGINSEHIYLGGSLVADVQHLTGGITRTRYKHTDALGSPVATTTETGAMEGAYIVYEPFGQALGAPIDGMGFTGHVMDPQSGMIYMQQRYYDPDVGRFLSVDPIAADSVGGLNFNRYNYGANNPYRYTDPDGRLAQEEKKMRSDPRSICERQPTRCSGGGTRASGGKGGGGGCGRTVCGISENSGGDNSSAGVAAPATPAEPYDEALGILQKQYPGLTADMVRAAYVRFVADNQSKNEMNWELTPRGMTPSRAGTPGGVVWNVPGDVLALGHTHGAGSNWRLKYFSDEDTSAAIQFDIPVFMSNPQGEFRVFIKGMEMAGEVPEGDLRGRQAEGELLCSDCIPTR